MPPDSTPVTPPTPTPPEPAGGAPIETPPATPPVKSREEEAAELEAYHKAELDKANEGRRKAEEAATRLRLENDRLRRRPEPDNEPQPPPDDMAEQVREAVNAAVQPLKRELERGRAEEIAAGIARNPEEKALILLHWETSVVSSGDLARDMRRAQLIANESRITQDIEELRQSATSRETRGAGPTGPGRRSTPEDAPTMAPEVLDVAMRMGLKPENVAARLKRTLERGVTVARVVGEK